MRLNADFRTDLHWWAYFHQCWFNISWVACPSWTDVPIAVKELLPIVTSYGIWGQQMRNLHVRCRCDNAAVVTMINRHAYKPTPIGHTSVEVLIFHLCKLVCRTSARMLEQSGWFVVKGQHTRFSWSSAVCRGIALLHSFGTVECFDTSLAKLAIGRVVWGFSGLPLLSSNNNLSI